MNWDRLNEKTFEAEMTNAVERDRKGLPQMLVNGAVVSPHRVWWPETKTLQDSLDNIMGFVGSYRDPVSKKYALLKAIRHHFPDMLTGFNRRLMDRVGVHGLNEAGTTTACGLRYDATEGPGEVEESLRISCDACKRVIQDMRHPG